MWVTELIWLPDVTEKLAAKHGLSVNEVEQVFLNGPRYYRIERGHREGEDLYAAEGRSDGGRLLVVFFVRKRDYRGLVISARDMYPSERRRYGRK